MRLWCRPGVTFELRQLKVLVAPAERMAALLEVPEIATFHALYLHYGLSEVLFRVPRQGPNLLVQSCMTVHQLLASLQEAYQTIVVVEYDDGIFSALEGGDRDVIFAVGRQLRELARSSTVLLHAPRAERGLRALLGTADQVVWRYDERPAATRTQRLRAVQLTIEGAGLAGFS